MRPKTIGIIGGAGPLAGATLFQRVVACAAYEYGCYRDADFPKIILLSFPFTEMLASDVDANQIAKELNECIAQLQTNGAETIAIACNTLHLFLDEDASVVHLPKIVQKEVNACDPPLLLCSGTSRRYMLHARYFPCVYPDELVQGKVDTLIDRTLMGDNIDSVQEDLCTLVQEQESDAIVLGCTELSIFTKALTSLDKKIIDPLDLVAQELVRLSFQEVTNVY